MKNLSVSFLIFTISILVNSCIPKANITAIIQGDYLVIGHPAGFVNTPYTTYYYLTSAQLTKDTTVLYAALPDSLTGFNFNAPATAGQYASVSNLLNRVPAELYGKNNQHIGKLVPDVGYIDIRSSINGTSYRWCFESDLSGTSNAIQTFVNQARTLFN